MSLSILASVLEVLTGDEVEGPALTWELYGFVRVVRTLDLFSMISKASFVVLIKKLPPAEALRESWSDLLTPL